MLPFAFGRHRATGDARPGAVDAGLEFTMARGGAFAAAVLLMMLSEQVLVSSGALFVRASSTTRSWAPTRPGWIFNILMVARAPLLLFQAVAASLLPHLTRLRTRADATGEDAFRMSVNNTLLIITGFAAAVLVGRARGRPEVMQIAFGDDHTYDRVRPRDRRRRHGLLPVGGHPQPGRARAGSGAPRGRLLGHLRDRRSSPST